MTVCGFTKIPKIALKYNWLTNQLYIGVRSVFELNTNSHDTA